jgi:hypothetical protein
MARMTTARKLLLGLLGGSTDPLTTILNKFLGGDDAAFQLWKAGGTQEIYMAAMRGTGDYYVNITLESSDFTIGANAFQLGSIDWKRLLAGYGRSTTPAFSENPASSTSSSYSYITGDVYYSDAAGYYTEMAFPVGTSSVGMATFPGLTNTGIGKVTIDGDATLADLLPTAQQLVDGGSLAAAALVGGGGTLNPTDRCVDFYNTSINYTLPNGTVIMFTESLSTGSAHTVRVTRTGYKNTASSGTSVFYCCFVGRNAANRLSNVPFVLLQTHEAVISSVGVFELSYNTKPTGAANSEWMGHSGSMKFKTLPVVAVNGSTITPTVRTWYPGTSVNLSFTSSLRHSQIDGGATEIGTLAINYAFDARTGLTMSHTLDWAMGGVCSGYPYMLPLDWAIYDRRKALDYATTAISAPTTSNQLTGQSHAVWLWDTNGTQGAIMYIADLANDVDNWAYSTNFWFVNTFTTLTKLYPQRFASDVAFTDATTWTASANYRFMLFPGGANAALA